MSNSREKETAPPDEILDIIWPALQVGGLSGVSGLTIGAFAGVLRSTTPTLFALASGIQWFTLGTTFWASRGAVIHAWGGLDRLSSQEKVKASAIAGSISGAAGGLLRGKRNVIPGGLMFAAFGAAGQAIYNAADQKKMEEWVEERKEKGDSKRWWDSKWSPMKKLSDGEYRGMLEERLLRVEVELGEVDEGIKVLRAENERLKKEGGVEKA